LNTIFNTENFHTEICTSNELNLKSDLDLKCFPLLKHDVAQAFLNVLKSFLKEKKTPLGYIALFLFDTFYNLRSESGKIFVRFFGRIEDNTIHMLPKISNLLICNQKGRNLW
jgi:hypothetical protein